MTGKRGYTSKRRPIRFGLRTGESSSAGPFLLDHLPLFADESWIGAVLFGFDRAHEWPPIASLLESRGLPKIDTLMGGRYLPAVRAFFDHVYGLDYSAPPARARWY